MQEVLQDKVEYVTFQDLSKPSPQSLTIQILEGGFTSKDWKKQFQTILNLRQANKHQPALFLDKLLPSLLSHIIAQIENLRSNNSKEALNLITELIQTQKIQSLTKEVIVGIINCLMVKSVCEKAFLKNEALKAINNLPQKNNQYIVNALNMHTQSQNGNISELAIKTLHNYLNHNKVINLDSQFFTVLCRNLNGKRAVVQKKAKEILECLKVSLGEENLENMVNNSNLPKEQSQIIINQIKKQPPKKEPQQSLKDFIKAKKTEKNQ